ncbi:MAG: glutaminyl-peptide cyclotransferase, partial [Candidatus Hydrogenedentes bacterium]|nr:glutaminyl-peptide cyclotransferase [Candidatus Hydrogenedentota bacterium]
MQLGVRWIAPLERRSVKLLIKAALLTALVVCGCVCMFSCPGGTQGSVTAYTYRVVNTYPHDTSAFTQGLDWDGGALYEGTGLTGKSSLRRVALETGEVLQRHDLAETYFGEGIAVFGGRIAQLTWQTGVGFVYDKTSFEETGQFRYPGEGWGLTYDGKRLIMSDGTSTLRFLDPDTFAQTGQVQVRDATGPVVYLNELEWFEGKILA